MNIAYQKNRNFILAFLHKIPTLQLKKTSLFLKSVFYLFFSKKNEKKSADKLMSRDNYPPFDRMLGTRETYS